MCSPVTWWKDFASFPSNIFKQYLDLFCKNRETFANLEDACDFVVDFSHEFISETVDKQLANFLFQEVHSMLKIMWVKIPWSSKSMAFFNFLHQVPWVGMLKLPRDPACFGLAHLQGCDMIEWPAEAKNRISTWASTNTIKYSYHQIPSNTIKYHQIPSFSWHFMKEPLRPPSWNNLHTWNAASLQFPEVELAAISSSKGMSSASLAQRCQAILIYPCM